MKHMYRRRKSEKDCKCAQRLGNIKSRCTKPTDIRYKNYGGKGIKCLLDINQLHDLWERDSAHLLKQASIDRINSDGDYTMENCRFVEMSENRINRKNSNNKKGVGASIKIRKETYDIIQKYAKKDIRTFTGQLEFIVQDWLDRISK